MQVDILKLSRCSLSEKFLLGFAMKNPQLVSSTWGKINDITLNRLSPNVSIDSVHIFLVWQHNLFNKFLDSFGSENHDCSGMFPGSSFEKCSNISLFKLASSPYPEHIADYMLFETCERKLQSVSFSVFREFSSTHCQCETKKSWIEGSQLCQSAGSFYPTFKSRKELTDFYGVLRLFVHMQLATEGLFIGSDPEVRVTFDLTLRIIYFVQTPFLGSGPSQNFECEKDNKRLCQIFFLTLMLPISETLCVISHFCRIPANGKMGVPLHTTDFGCQTNLTITQRSFSKSSSMTGHWRRTKHLVQAFQFGKNVL